MVHCMAGVSRSVTLVIAYIMQKSEASFSSAFNYVKSKRPIVFFLLKKDPSKWIICWTVNGVGKEIKNERHAQRIRVLKAM